MSESVSQHSPTSLPSVCLTAIRLKINKLLKILLLSYTTRTMVLIMTEQFTHCNTEAFNSDIASSMQQKNK